MALFIGIDIGTSGCRAMAIDAKQQCVAQVSHPVPAPQRNNSQVEQQAHLWWDAVGVVLDTLCPSLPRDDVKALAVDATSGTILLAEPGGQALTPALMYDDGRAASEAERIANLAPRNCAAHGATSSLAKLMWLQAHNTFDTPWLAAHQADWINMQLTGRYGLSDTNNCLKLGFDPATRQWPNWLEHLGIPRTVLPTVLEPGAVIGNLQPSVADRFGLPHDTRVMAGTTDSTAAVMATGITRPGQAVTSLGTTLVLKVLSEQPVFEPASGVYSQPFGDLWLVGGGSNSGGGVLKYYFSERQMQAMTPQLKPDEPTGLDYYPLLAPGERFPVSDPTMMPRLTPQPEDDARFFQALLEGIANIELQGYQRLAELGAPYPETVTSIGGGAANEAWTAIRRTLLGVPVEIAAHQEAAYGAALLALKGYKAAT
jgi:sugar (pentulose or hexulose) kinase